MVHQDLTVIQEQIAPMVDLELESLDTYVTMPLAELHRSKPITLRGPNSSCLRVWISLSRETFIGRSRYELGIHGRIVKRDSNEEDSSSEPLAACGESQLEGLSLQDDT
jgi:hypothetical protein